MVFTGVASPRANRLEFFRWYCDLPVELLVEPAWADMRHPSGWRPVHFLAQAVNRGHLQAPRGSPLRGLELLGGADAVVNALVGHGCRLNRRISDTADAAAGFTALHLLAKPHSRRTSEQLEDVLALAGALIRRTADVNARLPRTERTPLAIAATAGQQEMSRLLVAYGADPTAREGPDGLTPIELCRRGRQSSMASMLGELAARGAAGTGRQQNTSAQMSRPRRPERAALQDF